MQAEHDRPTLAEVRALRMAAKGRCPLVRAVDANSEAPVTYETVDGWLPMPNAIRACVRDGWMVLEPPAQTDGVVQNAVITDLGRQVLEAATCQRCGRLLVQFTLADDVCAPPSSCWTATWTDGRLTAYRHVETGAEVAPSES
jgi:hypothetical protein